MTTRTTERAPVDGLVLLDKPAGISSHDAVLAARRAIGERRIGHAGTLDPFATGILVLCTGRATRLLAHLPDEPKHYEAVVQWGAETDTEDLTGAVTVRAPVPDEHHVRALLPRFVGALSQVPPLYSAKRVGGQRAYEAARAGVAVALAPVAIEVHALTIDAWDGDRCRLQVVCGGGTYVRSLARDIARAAGSAAHLVALRRTRVGAFDVRDALPVPARGATLPVRPAVDALPHLPQLPLAAQDAARVRGGIAVAGLNPTGATQAALVHGEPPALVALAEWQDGRWQPRVVMHPVA